MVRRDVGNRRLLRLAEFLRQLPRGRFYYGHWIGHDWNGNPDLSCGTTACALGWATTMPLFRRLGLRLERDGGTGYPVIEMARHRTSGVYTANELFGISDEEALYLFIPSGTMQEGGRVLRGPTNLATATMVAAHIERFVARRERSGRKTA